MISEEEKVIANQYFQIGKLYVSVHKDDFEDDFAGMIGAIAEAEAKLKTSRCKSRTLREYNAVKSVVRKSPMERHFAVLVELPCRESEFRFPMIA